MFLKKFWELLKGWREPWLWKGGERGWIPSLVTCACVFFLYPPLEEPKVVSYSAQDTETFSVC